MEIEFKSDKEVLEAALHKWGGELQELIAIEEMAELTKALIKRRRMSIAEYDETKIVDEIADVQIMLWQLAIIYGRYHIEDAIAAKMERLKSRLETKN